MRLPGKIRSIKQPGWTDHLAWIISQNGRCVADVDHDWRISCTVGGLDAVVWNKGTPFDRKYFPTVAEALASLDYRIDGQARS